MRLSFAISLIAIALSAYASDDFDRQQIEQRIKPIGQVRVEGQEPAPTATAKPVKAEASAAKEAPGQATYEKYCSVCHRDGVAGAPKFRVTADWKPRIEQKKLDGLVASSLKGLNAMPPKGTCQECSEDDLKQAIQYMTSEHE